MKQEKPEPFYNFEEAVNVIEEKKSKDLRKEAAKKDRPISVPNMRDMIKTIEYATNLLDKDDVELKVLLRLRAQGFSHEEIAIKLGGDVKPETVRRLEQIAVNKVQERIHSSRLTHIPIVGGK